jgi:N-acetylglucosamine-6-sulfatase
VYIDSPARVADAPGRRYRVAPMTASRPQRTRGPAGAARLAAHAALVCALACLLAWLCGCGGSSGSNAPAGHARSASAGPGGAPAPPGSPRRDGRPNIVFVLTDDLSENLVRFMPHVVQMEHSGETFGNYFVTDSLCCPSRASILTGRFPHDTRVFDNSPPEGGYSVFHERGEERETFAVALQREGYSTALMGKYLNGYKPAGSPRESGSQVPPGWSEWDVAGDGYPEYGYQMNSDGHVQSYGYRSNEYLTDVIARKGLGFIARSAAQRRPFMLELATFAPHGPYTPARRDYGKFPGLRAPRTPAFNTIGTNEPAWLSRFEALGPRQIATIDAKFRKRAQAVQAVDRMIGEIEAQLSAEGIAQNTYIVFSSDNGLHMGEHRLRPGKLTAFDTDIKVPLVVIGPGVPGGRTVNQMTENVDLCPSFEELAGAPVPPSVDGHSLLALIHGRPARGWRKAILVEHHGRVYDRGDPDLPTRGSGNPPSYEALRGKRFLYVEYVTGEREFYDLRRDPFELHNVAATLSRGRLRRLHRMLAGIEQCHGGRACWRAQHGATGAT